MRRIYLIDCPGIVPIGMGDSETATVLKGVVRVEKVESPSEHIPALMARVKPEYLRQTYNLKTVGDAEDFLTQLARGMGKLLKGGEADLDTIAKMVINDWVRGKIPYYVEPPPTEHKNMAKGKDKAPLPDTETLDAAQGKRTVKGVSQPIQEIAVSGRFSHADLNAGMPEDFEATQGEEQAEAGYDDDDDDDDDDEEFSDDDQDDDDDADSELDGNSLQELAWSDVFGDAHEEEKAEAVESATEDNSDGDQVKEARMKTSKRKAENFYDRVNVKNKNRQKAEHMRELQKTSNRKERGSRIGANKKASRTALRRR